MRYEDVNTCAECGACPSGRTCDPARQKLRQYSGIRFTADGFDCALPVAIDSHSVCSYGCLYCFSDNLVEHRAQGSRPIGQTSLWQVEQIFAGDETKSNRHFIEALKIKKRGGHKYPCPIQLGAICDPLDNIERQQGWIYSLVKLAIKYQQPIRISTKGNLALVPEYLKLFEEAPHLFWVAFSIITPDDTMLAQIDRRAPSATERLACMQRLSEIGVKTSLRFRPMIPGLSDSTPRHPKAYKELIERSAEAGASAISAEVIFVPRAMTVDLRRRWERIERVIRLPLRQMYRSFGPLQACTRPAYTWSEGIMHAVAEEARACEMVVGISDPVWKQLGESGCCCGILPDDPVFGNWQEESATNQFLLAKGTGKHITFSDICPDWALTASLQRVVNVGVGPTAAWSRRYSVWSDHLEHAWDGIGAERGVLSYFQGALQPVKRDKGGHMVYKYVGLQRQHKPSVWKV